MSDDSAESFRRTHSVRMPFRYLSALQPFALRGRSRTSRLPVRWLNRNGRTILFCLRERRS